MNIVKKITSKKGFTLVELLIVIGILGVLAVSALVALNPAEAQKKSRDAKRLGDMANLQGALEQLANDDPTTFGTIVDVSSANGQTACNNNWIGVDLCSYMRQVPVDPSNRSVSTTNGVGTTAPRSAYYYLKASASGYKLCTYLESSANKTKLNNGGADANVSSTAEAVSFAVGSDLTLDCP